MENNQSQEKFDVSKCFDNFLKDFDQEKHRNYPKIHKMDQNDNFGFQKNLIETIKNGITRSQWNQIKNYSIIGNKQQKKKNYQIGIDHLFNLRSMYRKINSTLKVKGKQDKPKTPKITPIKTLKKKVIKNIRKKDNNEQLFNTLTRKQAELLKQQIPNNFDDSFEISLNQKKLHELQNSIKQKKTKKKTNRKKKIEPQKSDDKEEGENIDLNQNQKKTIKKVKNNTKQKNKKRKSKQLINKSKSHQFDLQDFEDFKNTREMELIKKNLEIFDENQNFIDDESFQISRDIEKLTEYKIQKKEDEEISIISDKNSGFSDFGDDMKQKLNQILISDMQEQNEDYMIDLRNLDEQEVVNFKKQIKDTIFQKKIFQQKEFDKFLETLIAVNSHIDSIQIQEIFDLVKEELYEQFKDEIEENINYQIKKVY